MLNKCTAYDLKYSTMLPAALWEFSYLFSVTGVGLSLVVTGCK